MVRGFPGPGSGSFHPRTDSGPCPIGATRGSTELAADVVLRVLLPRPFEDLLRVAELDEVAGAAALAGIDVEEAGLVGDALRLLEVVRDDGDGVLALQLQHQLFDLAGGDGVQRRTRL